MWQPGRDAAELTANGLDGKSKNCHGERSQHEGNDRTWDAFCESWEQQNDVREAAIDVVIAQSVPDGKYFTIKETTVNLTADPQHYQQMLEDGLTLSSNFTAVPAAYRLHVVVSDVASHAVGSLIIPIK